MPNVTSTKLDANKLVANYFQIQMALTPCKVKLHIAHSTNVNAS